MEARAQHDRINTAEVLGVSLVAIAATQIIPIAYKYARHTLRYARVKVITAAFHRIGNGDRIAAPVRPHQ